MKETCSRSAEETHAPLNEKSFATHLDYFAHQCGLLAEKALLYEAITTPKPGLIDCENNGAHYDMNLFTFVDSACMLRKYFEQCARIGALNQKATPEKIFALLRQVGMEADTEMLSATDGVNTHKGAIFLLGLLCGAAGMGFSTEQNLKKLLDNTAKLAMTPLKELQFMTVKEATTGGQKQYHQHGLTGARGEAASGFKTVLEVSLPVLEASLLAGLSLNDAGLEALVALMSTVADSNILRRGSMEDLKALQQEATVLHTQGITKEALRQLDEKLIRKHLSPGGCADLLAVTYFIYLLFAEKLL
jgi:holo-ACP synthase/triphosphoribosyl-dephospho-CoA synthase